MALIGTFTSTADGFTGSIKTLLLEAELTLSPLTRPVSDNPPDFLITVGKGREGLLVGAARKRKTENGRDYLSIRIDDPTLEKPICVGLYLADGSNSQYNLYWSRPYKTEDKL